MKQIKETETLTTIILEEGDILEVVSSIPKNIKIEIKCLNGTIHIDELPVEQIEQIHLENEANKAIKKYLNEDENN